MSAKKAFQRLLRTPKAERKQDLLSDREYNELASTSFQDYQRSNFNSKQLQRLSAAEVAQLETHYHLLEKKSERTQKRLRDKRQREVVPPVVVRYVPAPTAVLEQQEVPVAPDTTVNVREDDPGLRQVLDDIEKRIDAEPSPPLPEDQDSRQQETDGVQRGAVDELNVSQNLIDLSRAMPPKELLLEEPLAPEQPPALEELDLGPPGDAGAFLGIESPMPLSDRDVRNQLLQEFPSLGRPDVGGRFEDLDEAPIMMPPPPVTGILSSTPISGIPTAAVRRIPKRIGTLYDTDLSAIKGPTPTDGAAVAEIDTIVQPDSTNVSAEETPINLLEQEEQRSIEPVQQTLEPLQLTVSESAEPVPPVAETEPVKTAELVQAVEPVPETEPVQAAEPVPATELVQPEQQDVSASTESSSSTERPIERPRGGRKLVRKVPTYGEVPVVQVNLRAHFDINCGCDDLENFELMRALIQWITNVPVNRDLPPKRRSIPAESGEQQVRHDISANQAELSSIQERTQVRLFPIQERPEQEQLAEQELQHLSLPMVPTGAESVDHPDVIPAEQPLSNLPEISLGDADRALNAAEKDRIQFPDISTSIDIPQVVITDTSTDDTRSRLLQEIGPPPGGDKPAIEPPCSDVARAQPVESSGQDQSGSKAPVEQVTEVTEKTIANTKMLNSIVNTYFTVQREITSSSKRNSIPIGILAQNTSIGRAACAKRFMCLLKLKNLAYIEMGTDHSSNVQSISLRRH